MEGESLSPERLSPKDFRMGRRRIRFRVDLFFGARLPAARKKGGGFGLRHAVFPSSGLVRENVSAALKPFRTMPFPGCARKEGVMAEKWKRFVRSSGREGRTARGMPETGRRGVRMRRRLTDWGGSSAWFIREACRIGLCRVRFPLRVMFQDFGNDNGGIGEGDPEREAQCQRREQSEVRFFQGGEDWSAQSDHERDEQGMNRNRAHRSPPGSIPQRRERVAVKGNAGRNGMVNARDAPSIETANARKRPRAGGIHLGEKAGKRGEIHNAPPCLRKRFLWIEGGGPELPVAEPCGMAS